MAIIVLEGGRRTRLSPAAYQKRFGARYAPGIVAPSGVPAKLSAQCRAAAKALERGLAANELARYRRAAAARRTAPVFIAKVDERIGYGLFAARALPAGTVIGEYAGRLARRGPPAKRFNPYLMRFPFECAWAIDARRYGNELRFANHAARGVNLRRVHVLHGGLLHVLLVARRRVPAGRQLVYDYGNRYWRHSSARMVQ